MDCTCQDNRVAHDRERKECELLPSFCNNNLVGIDSRTVTMESYLEMGLYHDCVIGIWGMGEHWQDNSS